MITDSKFKYPKNNFTTINPLNMETINQGDQLAKLYGPALQAALRQGRQAFGDTSVAPSQYTLGGAAGLEASLSGLYDLQRTGSPVDTSAIYNSLAQKADRDARNTITPQIFERLGVRGGAYGSDVANAVSRAIGDLYTNIGVESARAGVASQEAAQGRRLTASQQAAQGNTALANIGSVLQALEESNLGRAYQEFQRMQQAPGAEYFTAIQNFMNTRPVMPTVVGAPPPAFEPGISWLDAVNSLSGLIGSVGSAAGGAGGASAACWVAAELYGWYTENFYLARKWIFELWQGPLADKVRELYMEHGPALAELVRKNSMVRAVVQPLFDHAVELARASEVTVNG